MKARRPGTASATAVLALAVFLGAGLLRSAAERAGFGVWNAASVRQEFQHAERNRAVLEAQAHRFRHEKGQAAVVAARLIGGTLTLEAAVEELEPVLAARDGFDDAWRSRHGSCYAPTFRKAVARYAINKATALLADEPGRGAEVSARLAAEYAALD
jgi:hypothetical protein